MKVEQFKEAIEGIGKGLSPDSDWMPAFFLEKDGRMAVIGMIGMGDSDEEKDRAADTMTMLIAITNADAACFISTSWIGGPPPPGQKFIRPSKHPQRKEAVTGFCHGVRGEADGVALLIGFIKRSRNKPPVISHWVLHESEEDNEITAKGRFPEAMEEGFKRADPSGNLGRLEAFLGKENKWREDEGTKT